MAAIDKVRIIIVGNSGVGKTSLAHLICHNEPLKSPGWTVGCSVEVKLHEYKEGTPSQRTYFVEFWDVGGSRNHSNTRPVFYHPCHGIVLVHDLTNSKSEQSLQQWLAEVVNSDACTSIPPMSPTTAAPATSSSSSSSSSLAANAPLLFGTNTMDFDPEFFVPMLVVGTKLDLAEDKARRNTVAQLAFGADEILLDCRSAKYLAAGSSNAVKLSRFFDKVIERKYYTRDADKKKYNLLGSASYISPNTVSPISRAYHMD